MIGVLASEPASQSSDSGIAVALLVMYFALLPAAAGVLWSTAAWLGLAVYAVVVPLAWAPVYLMLWAAYPVRRAVRRRRLALETLTTGVFWRPTPPPIWPPGRVWNDTGRVGVWCTNIVTVPLTVVYCVFPFGPAATVPILAGTAWAAAVMYGPILFVTVLVAAIADIRDDW